MSAQAGAPPAIASLGQSAAGQRSLAKSVKAVLVWLIFAGIALSTIYPLVFLTATALRPQSDYNADPAGVPGALTLDNISGAFNQAHVGTYALNSFYVVVPAVLLVTALATLAAYALTHFEIPLRRTALALVVLLMAIPPTILLIPIFKVVLDAGLLNDRLGLILVYTALMAPFSIYLLASFMRGVPTELLQAARIDGAGPLRILWSVVIPLVKPALLTLLTLNFLFLWNELLFSLVILQTEEARTIMVGIAQAQGQFQKNLGVVSAGLLLSMIPPLLIFAFFQRSLARGLTAGAVK
jgi:ABC-type glycerol-3-phosphate transport system permease component